MILIPLLGLLAGLVAAIGGGSSAAPSPAPGATVDARVAVPAGLRQAPFDRPRWLRIPRGFRISVYGRVPGARFMARLPNGDLLVSQPGLGRVVLLRPRGGSGGGAPPRAFTWARGLRAPHDIVPHRIGRTLWIYLSESHRVTRSAWRPGETRAGARQVVVRGLPDASTPELRGAYAHALKNIALDRAHHLYVSIASTCNACVSDTRANPVRGAIYRYDARGGGRRLWARGIRNAEGLAFVPGTDDLWIAVNNRDQILYPYHRDADGDGRDDYGRLLPAYVDDHPPEELTRVRPGADYGWPFCNPNPDTPAGLERMPFDRDVQLNPDGRVDCRRMTRIDQGIQAHSAPLGLTFLQGSGLPAPYRDGLVVALHGSWNRQRRTGYKLAWFPWDAARRQPTRQADLVTGWLDVRSQQVWGRPVDAAPDGRGGLFVSDDGSGTVYRLARAG